MEKKTTTISVIIPAFNEQHTVGEVIADTIQVMDSEIYPYEIIVVNDGSTDKTAQEASKYKATVLTNEKNMGKGYSIRRALKQTTGDIIVTMDSDGEHRPKEIPDLIKPLFSGTDIVNGSRILGASPQFTTKLNQIGNKIFNLSILLLTGNTITDSQTGFRAAKRKVFEKLELNSDGYEIETEIIVKTLRSGFVLEEKPVTICRRQYSASKIKIMQDGMRILKTILACSI